MKSLYTIDLQFLKSAGVIASYLIKNKEENILIETGPSSTLAFLLKELTRLKIAPESIKHVFLTHVHLDHAGAAWYFAKLGAQIYVHPKGAQHLNKPQKLWDSAKRIYKNDMDKLWGEMQPIPKSKITAVKHLEKVKAGKLKLKAMHSPGHASHHISWQLDDILFSGDVGGVKINNGPVFPPCPPPDIDIEAWLNSIKLIKSKRYRKLYLTHFGEISDVKSHLIELEGRLRNFKRWMGTQLEMKVSDKKILKGFESYVSNQMKAHGVKGKQLKQYELANPTWMSVYGLKRYWQKISK